MLESYKDSCAETQKQAGTAMMAPLLLFVLLPLQLK